MPTVLETKRLSLRPLRRADVTDAYIDGLNDPAVNQYLEVRFSRQTRKSVEDFVAAHEGASDRFLFGVFLKDRLIGTVRLHSISRDHYCAIVGICLFAADVWGIGYGLEALDRVVRFGFDELGLHFIEAGCYEENQASRKLFGKAGFTEQAVISDRRRLGARFVREMFMSRVNPDFKLPY